MSRLRIVTKKEKQVANRQKKKSIKKNEDKEEEEEKLFQNVCARENDSNDKCETQTGSNTNIHL